MDKIALRLAEATVLRAEAALEKYQAKKTRNNGTMGVLDSDEEQDNLYATMHEAKAELLLAQAAWVEHSDQADRWRLLQDWLREESDLGKTEVSIEDVLRIIKGEGKP